MKDVAVADTRSVVIMGHTGSGKTSLIDAFLFKLGVNDRLGAVDAGSSMADYTDEEKARKITIYAKSFGGLYKGGSKPAHLVFLDTPGYMDFIGQLILASRAAGAGLLAVDAVSGVQVGTNRAWKQLVDSKLPRGIVITGLDRENANFDQALEQIRAAFGEACVPVVLPLEDRSGVVDILASTDGGPMADQVSEFKGKLVELAAETDDTLLEKYLGGQALSAEEISVGLRKAVVNQRFVPVFACASLKDIGVKDVLDGLVRLFPSPVEAPVQDTAGKPINPAPDAPFVGFVWRTVNDPFVGQLSFVRVCGGTLREGTEIYNATKEQKERVSTLAEMSGKKQAPLGEATAGDIVALAKLKVTTLGDVLCAPGHKVSMPPFAFPHPVMAHAVRAKTDGDEDKLGTAIARLGEEDPTIKVERNSDTHETVLSGMGDVHLDVAVERMKRRSNVDVVLSVPRVPYKETVQATGEGHYKHKKQTGGRGQFGEVYLRVSPLPAGETEWFENDTFGGSIPGNFLPAIQKGIVDTLKRGVIAGNPVVNVKVSIYDGSYHDVDSSEIAFKIAGSRAFQDGVQKAKPVLLEPIMTVRVMVPDSHMGDVNGDLSHKRGHILGLESKDGVQVITAEVPQAELSRYCAELRSMTGGRGTFEMEFARYEVVPSNIAQKVIAEAAKNKKEHEEE